MRMNRMKAHLRWGLTEFVRFRKSVILNQLE